ncbi:MAG: rod shape-determining protein MreD [Actinomycetota bacterium]|nr:rod shape-determining protein MreD [Actinomycetota bacterium]
MSTARSTPGSFAEIGIGRVAAVAAILVGALVLQSTLVVQVTILGVIPQLVLVVVVSLAFTDGPRVGVVTAFAGGLLQDLLLPQSIVGLTALVYVLIAYAVGRFREFSTTDSVWAPVIAVAVSSFAAEVSYALLAVIMGQPWVSFTFTAKVIGLVVLYNTLLTPLTFPLVRRVADRFRPERVYRW